MMFHGIESGALQKALISDNNEDETLLITEYFPVNDSTKLDELNNTSNLVESDDFLFKFGDLLNN